MQIFLDDRSIFIVFIEKWLCKISNLMKFMICLQFGLLLIALKIAMLFSGLFIHAGNRCQGRFKDYIAMPKQNMYQSLAYDGYRTERRSFRSSNSYDMKCIELLNSGLLHTGHIKKVKTINERIIFEEKLTWFREILEFQNDTINAEEFMESLKIDLFSDMVYVFTPKGDVIELPSGSVPIDFAYRVHSEIGNKTIGAKVNGKMVTLDYKFKTGDIIEILTSKHSYGPSQDWLKLAQTSQAKNKIRAFFKKQRRDENIDKRQRTS